MTDLNNQDYIAYLTNQALPLANDQAIVIAAIKQVYHSQDVTVDYDAYWPAELRVPLTLRRYQSQITYWQVEDHHKCEREWAVLRRLRLDKFPCPRPVARGETDEHPYLIWLTPIGQSWAEPEAERIEQLKPAIPQIASFMTQLHGVDLKGLNNEPLYQATVAGTLVRMLLWSRQMGNEELRAMIARLKPAVARLKSWPPALLHGDLHLDKIVAHYGEILAFQGWEQAAIGDPRWDVMTTAHSFRALNQNLAEQFVNWYETFSGRAIEDRAFWWAMISVRLWAIKSWAVYALETGQISTNLHDWVADLAQVKEQAIADLAAARL